VWLSGNAALTDIATLLDNPGIGSGNGVNLRGTAVSCLDACLLVEWARAVLLVMLCPD